MLLITEMCSLLEIKGKKFIFKLLYNLYWWVNGGGGGVKE